MRKLCLFFVLLLITAAFACDNDPTGPDVIHILPLALGNSWTFSYYDIYPIGTTLSVSTEKIEVVSSSVIDDEVWYILEYILNGDTLDKIHTTYVTNRANGVYSMTIPYHPEPLLVYKYPAKKGDTYNSSQSPEFMTEVIAVDTLIDAPYGEDLKCYHYESGDPSSIDMPIESNFLMPGLGYVLMESCCGFDGHKYVRVLEEAAIK